MAAQQRHELFSAGFLPWLGTGEPHRVMSSLQQAALMGARLACFPLQLQPPAGGVQRGSAAAV